jgi:hypothetical protein
MRSSRCRTYPPWLHGSTTVDDSGLAASEAVTYSFRNKIRLGDKKLHSDETKCPLDKSDGGEVVTLSALRGPTGESFTTADWLLLAGRGYKSSDQAFAAGRLWRQYLSVVFAPVNIGADFDPLPLPDRQRDDRPESPEVPGLLVYPVRGLMPRWDVSTRGEAPITLELVVTHDLPEVRSVIPNGLDRRLELAYSLVHLALSNANPDVQFILWITAIEALIADKKPKKKEAEGKVVEYLEQLGEQVVADKQKFNRKVRERVAGLLELAQEETITELGKTLARKLDKEYNEKPPDKFFEENYRARSRLVHGSIDEEKRLEPREIRRRLPHLRQFVMDLLKVEAASAKEADQPSDDDSGDSGR